MRRVNRSLRPVRRLLFKARVIVSIPSPPKRSQPRRTRLELSRKSEKPEGKQHLDNAQPSLRYLSSTEFRSPHPNLIEESFRISGCPEAKKFYGRFSRNARLARGDLDLLRGGL